MWKGCAYANASRNAVFAAMLAARGMTGPSPVFEGEGGYFRAVTRKAFELATLGGPEASYKIMECSVKRFPLGQYSQTVVEAALQEDVDAIGISILSGAHMTVFPKVINIMKEKEMTDVLLTGGGIIPDDDMKKLNSMGVGKLFAPGTPTSEIASYISSWVKEHRPF